MGQTHERPCDSGAPCVQTLAALAACPQWPLAVPEGMDMGVLDMQG